MSHMISFMRSGLCCRIECGQHAHNLNRLNAELLLLIECINDYTPVDK